MNRIALANEFGERAGWFDASAVTHEFPETTRWDGNNHIGNATCSQWTHETLYVTRKGRFVILRESQRQGSLDTYREISVEYAALWLVRCGYDIPDDMPGLRRVDAALEKTEV